MAADLTVWDWKSGDPAAAAYFAKAKEVFEAAHPGDTITYVMQPNDQYYTLLGTALASDGGPDLFLLNGGAQARARFAGAVNLDGKLGDLQGNLAGLPSFTSTRSCMPRRGWTLWGRKPGMT
jgi:raffinose/stachyose/melibiose transport system substrate-binding protein